MTKDRKAETIEIYLTDSFTDSDYGEYLKGEIQALGLQCEEDEETGIVFTVTVPEGSTNRAELARLLDSGERDERLSWDAKPVCGVPWWKRPVIELPLSSREVSRCCIDNALRLYFSGSDEGYRPPDWWGDPATAAGKVQIAIEREFRLRHHGKDQKLSPEGDLEELGSAAVLYRKVVHQALAYRDGSLEVRFRDGTHIWVPSHPEYEPWQVEGPAGLLVVSVPGGELAIFAPRGETDGGRAT